MAMSILSCFSVEEIYEIISNSNAKSFKKVSGVGGKIANRIINELKQKKSFKLNSSEDHTSNFSENNDILEDACAALVGLGFKSSTSLEILKKVYRENIALEELITKALKHL